MQESSTRGPGTGLSDSGPGEAAEKSSLCVKPEAGEGGVLQIFGRRAFQAGGQQGKSTRWEWAWRRAFQAGGTARVNPRGGSGPGMWEGKERGRGSGRR